MLKNLLRAGALALASLICAIAPAAAQNYSVKDANANALTFRAAVIGGGLVPFHLNVDSTGAVIFASGNPGYVAITGTPTFNIGTAPNLTLTNTAFGAKLQDATGAAFGTSGNPIYVTGGTGGSGTATPTGTAGTPNAAVVTVQGPTSGGTPVPVSNTALGTPTDAAYSDATGAASGSLVALFKGYYQILSNKTDQSPVTMYLPQLTATDYGASVGTSSVQLMPANTSRHGIQVQVQSSSASCYIRGAASGVTAATADYHSLKIGSNAYFESSTHVSTGIIYIICDTAATPVYARDF